MRICVDFTDYIHGGANGGIVPLTLATINELKKIDDVSFVVLTNDRNHDSLEYIEDRNVRRVNVTGIQHINDRGNVEDNRNVPFSLKKFLKIIYLFIKKLTCILFPEFIYQFIHKNHLVFAKIKNTIFHPIKNILKPIIKAVLPHGLYVKLIENKKKKANNTSEVTKEEIAVPGTYKGPYVDLNEWCNTKIDIMYCPFTAVNYVDKNIPIVSTLHDIQHKYYPWFFSQEEINSRDNFYNRLIRIFPYIISVSEFTKNTFVEKYKYDANRINVILSSVQDRLKEYPEENDSTILKGLDITDDFLFYPANFWKHKNHISLLVAFNMYIRNNKDSKLKLVLTGFSSESSVDWDETLEKMGLQNRVMLLGYVSNDVIAALMRKCRIMVFPSLYEGFGIPIVEAMACNATIACSNITAIPEVAGDCVFYFNPYKPEDIYEKIEFILNNPKEVDNKKKMYKEQLKKYSLNNYTNSIYSLFKKIVEEK